MLRATVVALVAGVGLALPLLPSSSAAVSADTSSSATSFNNGFEVADGGLPAGWSRMRAQDATFARDTAVAHSGTASARISNSGGDATGVPDYYVQPVLTVIPGQTYAASAWARGANATGGTRIAFAWYNASHTYLGQVESAWLPNGTTPWTLLTVSGAAPANAAIMEIHLKSSFNSGSAWFDDVTFTPPANAPATPSATPVLPTATATATPVPPTATATHTPLPPTATATHTPLPPTATPTRTPAPPTATATRTPTPPTPTATAPSDSAPSFGMNDHLTWSSVAQANTDLDHMKAAGLTSVRTDLYWENLEPRRGSWDSSQLSNLDGFVAAIEAHSMHGVFTVLGTPAWARNGGTDMTPPANPSDYGMFMGQLAGRYASHANMTWEIWNEPSDPHFWNAPVSPNPAFYTRMLQSAYTNIKAHAPHARVLGGSIAFYNKQFLDGMYAAGAKGYFDALAIHPYTQGSSPQATGNSFTSFPDAVQGMEQDMTSHGQPNEPIWITEMGWSTSNVSDATRAAYVAQVVGMVRGWPFVKEYDLFGMHQSQDGSYGLSNGNSFTATWSSYSNAVKQ